jgi:hypothetical protein
MYDRQGRIFCTTKNLKGTVNRVEKTIFWDPAKKLVWSDKLQCLPNANPNAKKVRQTSQSVFNSAFLKNFPRLKINQRRNARLC